MIAHNPIISYLALLQGCFVVGLTFNIILYNLRHKPLTFTTLQVICMALSYVLITIATLIVVTRPEYAMGDTWYLLVGLGYLFGDVGLLTIYGSRRSKAVHQKYQERLQALLGKHLELS